MGRKNSNENPKIIVLVGLSGSGKSTWAKKHVSNKPSFIRVNRDDFRFMFKDAPICENKIESLITDVANNTIDLALSRRLNVIIDNTHLKAKYINDIITRFQSKANIEFLIFDTSMQKCIERDSNRDKQVGKSVIEKQNKDFKILKDSFVFQPVKAFTREENCLNYFSSKVKYDNNLKDAVIFDIDGTLAIMNRHPFNWDKVDLDLPNNVVIDHLNMHRQLGRKIILTSGRDCAAREKTEKWLNENRIRYDFLFMRGDIIGKENSDYRKDSVVKKEIYEYYIKGKYNIHVVFDDRKQVVDLWRELGLHCFQVNDTL